MKAARSCNEPNNINKSLIAVHTKNFKVRLEHLSLSNDKNIILRHFFMLFL